MGSASAPGQNARTIQVREHSHPLRLRRAKIKFEVYHHGRTKLEPINRTGVSSTVMKGKANKLVSSVKKKIQKQNDECVSLTFDVE